MFALDSDRTRLTELEKRHWRSSRPDCSPQKTPPTLYCLQCDVSDESSVAAAASAVGKLLSELGAISPSLAGVHAIVNLAGVYGGGPLMELDTAALEKVLSINTVGPHRVNQAFFPLLRRRADDCHARLINVASELSAVRLSPALTGPYAMSKWAVEAYSIALRQELSVLEPPVDVTILRPGPILTELPLEHTVRGAEVHAKREGGSLWADGLQAVIWATKQYAARNGVPPPALGALIARLVHARSPPMTAEFNVTPEMRLASWMPQWLLDAVAKRTLRGPSQAKGKCS